MSKKRPFPRSRLSIPGRTTVTSPGTGLPMRCIWDDCERPGYEEIKILIREPNKTLHALFCSERHRRLYVHSHREYGKLGA